MNILKGIIEETESDENVSLVRIRCGSRILSAVVLETPDTAAYLARGRNVSIFFKESEVAIAKNRTGEISLQNRFDCRISRIRTAGILSEITFDLGPEGDQVVSLITRSSLKRLGLKEGDTAEWLIEATEISIRDEEVL